jgi:hypothetical protein
MRFAILGPLRVEGGADLSTDDAVALALAV